jgi:hypothetical protein
MKHTDTSVDNLQARTISIIKNFVISTQPEQPYHNERSILITVLNLRLIP